MLRIWAPWQLNACFRFSCKLHLLLGLITCRTSQNETYDLQVSRHGSECAVALTPTHTVAVTKFVSQHGQNPSFATGTQGVTYGLRYPSGWTRISLNVQHAWLPVEPPASANTCLSFITRPCPKKTVLWVSGLVYCIPARKKSSQRVVFCRERTV